MIVKAPKHELFSSVTVCKVGPKHSRQGRHKKCATCEGSLGLIRWHLAGAEQETEHRPCLRPSLTSEAPDNLTPLLALSRKELVEPPAVSPQWIGPTRCNKMDCIRV